jgi:predicted nucleic acid-binding protein
MPRVMLDANVLIAAFCHARGANELLARARAGELGLVLCPYLLAEARRMIGRAFPRRQEAFEAMLAATPHELVPDASPEAVAAQRGLVEDPADVPVALAAIAAGVDALVSSDRHLIGPAAALLQASLRTMNVHDFLHGMIDESCRARADRT